jgi:hypothetical protein
MNHLKKLAGTVVDLLVLLPVALGCVTGCAARSAPFDQMDRAQITVLRLSSSQPAGAPAAQPGLLPAIPGVPIPPEVQALGQQVLQGVQNALPGLIPGATLPGLPGAQPQQPPPPQFKGFSIVAQAPVMDAAFRDELLDIFGHESNFNNQAQPCFTPGMGIVLQRPNTPEVDLLVSLACNQAKMDGARWPYAINGFTPETRDHLGKIYEKLWGPVPPGA